MEYCKPYKKAILRVLYCILYGEWDNEDPPLQPPWSIVARIQLVIVDSMAGLDIPIVQGS